MLIIYIIIATMIATFIGGQIALRAYDKLHIVSAFGAGAIIATALFDLLPEGIKLGGVSTAISLNLCAIGFAVYFIINNYLAIKAEHACDNNGHNITLSAGGLSLHSVMDGFIIGMSFYVSTSIGIVVAIAILAHDIADGINTVGVVRQKRGTILQAKRWLLIDAIAPMLGLMISQLFTISLYNLSLLLSLFSGMFLYIGASELVPECHHEHPKAWTSISFIFGMLFIWWLVHLGA